MKKSIICSFALAMIVSAGLFTAKSFTASAKYDLLMANIEALANDETPQKYVCFNTITYRKDYNVFYCGTCSWESDSDQSWVSGESTCTK